MRLFIAIDIPASIRKKVSTIFQSTWPFKWVPIDNLHLTLQFLGDQNYQSLNHIEEALSEVLFFPFELQLRGLSLFSCRDQSHILYVAVAEEPALTELQHNICDVLKKYSIKFEGKKFIPHVTISRVDADHSTLLPSFLLQNEGFETSVFQVESYSLYQSTLTSEGPVYRLIKRFD